MKNRTQQVQNGTTTSERVPLHYGVPQGSVLGPVMFTLQTTPMQHILKRHGIKYHKYADDLQLFIIFYSNIPGDREKAVAQMEAFVQEIRQWMTYRWLKLNDEKTQMPIFTSNYHLYQYGTCNIEISDSAISPAKCVRNFGFNMDQRHLIILCAQQGTILT